MVFSANGKVAYHVLQLAMRYKKERLSAAAVGIQSITFFVGQHARLRRACTSSYKEMTCMSIRTKVSVVIKKSLMPHC